MIATLAVQAKRLFAWSEWSAMLGEKSKRRGLGASSGAALPSLRAARRTERRTENHRTKSGRLWSVRVGAQVLPRRSYSLVNVDVVALNIFTTDVRHHRDVNETRREVLGSNFSTARWCRWRRWRGPSSCWRSTRSRLFRDNTKKTAG